MCHLQRPDDSSPQIREVGAKKENPLMAVSKCETVLRMAEELIMVITSVILINGTLNKVTPTIRSNGKHYH